MKRTFTALSLAILCFVFMPGASGVLLAQDIIDVEQGYETLNLAVEGDTLADGTPASFSRVWRLTRGGVYLINGTIKGNGSPLRIVAAEGDGPKPLLISIADETGGSDRYFRPKVDAEWRGLYMSGIDNLGNQVQKNCFRLGKEGGRYIIDDCVVDGDQQSFCRIDAQEQKVFVTNCKFSNSYRLASTGNGRFLDTRGNTTDTLFVQNCTFFNCIADAIRNGGGIIKNFVFDHVTIDKGIGWGSDFEMDRNVFNQFTNNLLMNMGWEGRELFAVDSTNECIIPVDSLLADDIATEEQRQWNVTNNVMGWSDDIKTWITGQDSMQLYPWKDYMAEVFFATMSNFVFENNILEDVVFSDGPDNTLHLAFMEHRLNNDHGEENNPEIRLDRNGVGPLTEDPNSINTFGPADDDYDFDYANTFAAYTHAAGGFPVGDLNWFPDKKAEWEAAGKPTAISYSDASAPRQFKLAQNYPNPFNPSTSIGYLLNRRGSVKLSIYNVLGQKVRIMVNEKMQAAGEYNVLWDGRDDAGILVPSGMYVYRLEAGDQVQSRKMMLMK